MLLIRVSRGFCSRRRGSESSVVEDICFTDVRNGRLLLKQMLRLWLWLLWLLLGFCFEEIRENIGTNRIGR